LTVPKIVPRRLRKNAQYNFCAVCALLRNVWRMKKNQDNWYKFERQSRGGVGDKTQRLFEIMPAFESGAYFLIYHNSIAAHEVGMCRMAGENN
jgi:hypothetical protein